MQFLIGRRVGHLRIAVAALADIRLRGLLARDEKVSRKIGLAAGGRQSAEMRSPPNVRNTLPIEFALVFELDQWEGGKHG